MGLRGLVWGLGVREGGADIPLSCGQYDEINAKVDLKMRSKKYLEIGIRYLEKGNYESAIKAFKLSLDANPYFISTWNAIGEMHIMRKSYDEAERSFKRAIVLDPSYYYPWRETGWIKDSKSKEYYKLGGQENIKKEISIAWSGIARIKHFIKENELARIYLERAIEIDSNNHLAWNILGDIFLQKDEVEKSIEFYYKSIEISKKQAIPLNGLGLAFFKKGKYSKALRFFKKAISLSPSFPEYWHNLGKTYKKTNKIKNAIAAFEKSIEINSRYFSGWTSLGYLYKELENYGKSIFYFENARSIHPKNDKILVELGTLYGLIENYEEATNAFEKALKINPKSFPKKNLEENKLKNYIQQLKEQGESQLFEAKIIVIGGGAVGKTTLVKKLKNPEYKVPCIEPSTHGIQISDYNFQQEVNANNIVFNSNIWDFGGQEIYHSTHQFFLTKRSLYILVIDSRTEEDDYDYWLHVATTLGQNSPILIVINEKEDRRKDLDLAFIRTGFPSVVDYVRVNFATNRGLDFLRSKIHEELCNLPHIGQGLPKKWANIRQSLEKKDDEYISLSHYYELCESEKIYNEKQALLISDFLHDLGAILHFQNDFYLENILILSPEWVTQAVYDIFNSQLIINNNGRFNLKDLKSVWSKKYPREKYPDLIRLINKFQLCYRLDNIEDEYIAPHLLSEKPPNYHFEDENILQVQYHYPFLPKGIIHRFIVKTHDKIQVVWKNGVVISDRKNTVAEIIQNKFEKTIEIKVAGSNAKELLYLIRSNLKKINDSFISLKCNERVPCICEKCKSSIEPMFYEIEILENAKRKGKQTIECYKSFEAISVKRLTESLNTTLSTINELKGCISNADYKTFFKLMHLYTEGTELENDVIHISAQFSSYEQKLMKGVIDVREESRIFNQIIKSSLFLIDNLEELNKNVL